MKLLEKVNYRWCEYSFSVLYYGNFFLSSFNPFKLFNISSISSFAYGLTSYMCVLLNAFIIFNPNYKFSFIVLLFFPDPLKNYRKVREITLNSFTFSPNLSSTSDLIKYFTYFCDWLELNLFFLTDFFLLLGCVTYMNLAYFLSVLSLDRSLWSSSSEMEYKYSFSGISPK